MREIEGGQTKEKIYIVYIWGDMKKLLKWIIPIIVFVCVVVSVMVLQHGKPFVVKTYRKHTREEIDKRFNEGKLARSITYYKMSDGTWKTDHYTYKYRQKLIGRQPGAVYEGVFVYLTNEEITFTQAWKGIAGGAAEDLFNEEDARLVELGIIK